MPKISASKQLSLSDLIRNPSSIVKDFDEIPDDNDAEYVKEYGIGIDCHSKFIEVCIRYRCGKLIYKAQSTFTTEWDSLVAARDWCLSVLKTKADPVPDLSEPLHYLVESNISCGLSLSGTVIDRTRRMVPRDNPTIEIVTYTVQDSCSRKYYVDDFAPSEYHDINSSICFPVYIKAYRRKNGEPSYTINVQKTEVGRGEHF